MTWKPCIQPQFLSTCWFVWGELQGVPLYEFFQKTKTKSRSLGQSRYKSPECCYTPHTPCQLACWEFSWDSSWQLCVKDTHCMRWDIWTALTTQSLSRLECQPSPCQLQTQPLLHWEEVKFPSVSLHENKGSEYWNTLVWEHSIQTILALELESSKKKKKIHVQLCGFEKSFFHVFCNVLVQGFVTELSRPGNVVLDFCPNNLAIYCTIWNFLVLEAKFCLDILELSAKLWYQNMFKIRKPWNIN